MATKRQRTQAMPLAWTGLCPEDVTKIDKSGPVLASLESELSHDIFRDGAEMTERWWALQKHLYVRLFTYCIVHRCTTFISVPVEYEHEVRCAAQKAAAERIHASECPHLPSQSSDVIAKFLLPFLCPLELSTLAIANREWCELSRSDSLWRPLYRRIFPQQLAEESSVDFLGSFLGSWWRRFQGRYAVPPTNLIERAYARRARKHPSLSSCYCISDKQPVTWYSYTSGEPQLECEGMPRILQFKGNPSPFFVVPEHVIICVDLYTRYSNGHFWVLHSSISKSVAMEEFDKDEFPGFEYQMAGLGAADDQPPSNDTEEEAPESELGLHLPETCFSVAGRMTPKYLLSEPTESAFLSLLRMRVTLQRTDSLLMTTLMDATGDMLGWDRFEGMGEVWTGIDEPIPSWHGFLCSTVQFPLPHKITPHQGSEPVDGHHVSLPTITATTSISLNPAPGHEDAAHSNINDCFVFRKEHEDVPVDMRIEELGIRLCEGDRNYGCLSSLLPYLDWR
jgi:hypothetical protein